jgi:hypothetical protein
MKSILHCIIFLVFLLGFSSCKKDEDEVVPPVSPGIVLEPSAELKAYALFKPGSYWIYKNTTDNSIDSLYVKAIDTFSNSTNAYCHVTFGIEDSIPVYYHLFGHFVLMKEYTTESVHVSGLPMFMSDTTVLVNPGNYGISENRSLGFVNIQKQNYDSCRYIKCMNRNYYAPSQTYFDYTCELIWKKHIGIIKFQQSGHPDLNSWELIRYDVRQ